MRYAIIFTLLFLFSCQEEVYLPKPRGFHRIELPAHKYAPLASKNSPYQFEVSDLAKVKKDPHFLAQEHWIEIEYPEFDAQIDISYKKILNRADSLSGFVATSHKLTRKHSVRASKIEEFATIGGKEQNLPAVVFELEGEVPSYFHWYAHDSTNHFVRAALYFERAESADSLKPVIEYLKVDMMHLLNTLEFEQK